MGLNRGPPAPADGLFSFLWHVSELEIVAVGKRLMSMRVVPDYPRESR